MQINIEAPTQLREEIKHIAILKTLSLGCVNKRTFSSPNLPDVMLLYEQQNTKPHPEILTARKSMDMNRAVQRGGGREGNLLRAPG